MSTLMVVDDEKFIREIIAKKLAREGFDVLTAEDGQAALDQLKTLQPEVIITDLKMPVMDGFSLLKNLHDTDFPMNAVIVLTGHGSDQDIADCYALGIHTFLRKPINSIELIGLVRNILRFNQINQELHHLNKTLEQKVQERTQALEQEIEIHQQDQLKLKEVNQQLQISISELERLSRTFKLFVPPQFLNRIQTIGPDSLQAGDAEEEKLTILFSDIRSFMQLSESMTPQEIFDFLNGYLQLMEPCVSQHQGFIDKFIGDGIMALFDESASASAALDSAIAMQQALQHYNDKQESSLHPRIRVGIGINTGPVVIGALGSADRIDSTVVGEAVNLAARLEELTKKYKAGILISQYTHIEIDETAYLIREVETVRIRGKSTPITIYEVFDCDTSEVRDKKLATSDLLLHGIILYKCQAFPEALEMFGQCLAQFPGDVVAQEYVKRCQYFQKHPPKNRFWDGVVEDSTVLINHEARRRFERHPFAVELRLHVNHEENDRTGHAVDISLSGMMLEVDHPVQVDDIVMVQVIGKHGKLALPRVGSYHFLGRVVWQRFVARSAESPSWKVGLEFIMMPMHDEHRLHSLLKRL